MTPEVAYYIEKAHQVLTEADLVLGIGLTEAAGRNAYLAAFHAAQALIFQRRNLSVKTHRGVQIEFLRLIKDESSMDPILRGFLSKTFDLKMTADYGVGPHAILSAEEAVEVIAESRRFVAQVLSLLSDGPPCA